ncbi:MAG: putative electron transport protein [Bacteroidetes bacterium]|nr:putative electron transport protein [Bacteroidota bacterium]
MKVLNEYAVPGSAGERFREVQPDGRPRIKKLLPELRKPKPAYRHETVWYKRIMLRLSDDSQYQRSAVQYAFALLCIWIGIEFYLFMSWGASGGQESFYPRPPGVEGFLPISALISLKYWMHTGIINTIHPSGLFIVLAIVGVSLVVKKAFCSWLCPVGTLSESLWMLGQKLFRRNWTVPRWLDYPLRSIKYLLLFFFVWSIVQMDVGALAGFIYSPYNRVADIKMYLFFAEISGTALWTIGLLMLLSVFVKNFWCRFLCPYGALLGIVGWFSPLKVTRTASTCIDCELCTKACPANIKVHTAGRVWSDECTSCFACVQACPVKNTLEVRARAQGRAVPFWVLGTLVAALFVAVTGIAMLSGHWQNGISQQEYQRRFNELHSPLYQHFRGEVPQYGPND